MIMANDMIKKVKYLALLFFLISGIFFSAGCQRSDGPVKEKAESPEAKTKGDQGKDEHDTVILSAEKQKMAGIEVRTASP